MRASRTPIRKNSPISKAAPESDDPVNQSRALSVTGENIAANERKRRQWAWPPFSPKLGPEDRPPSKYLIFFGIRPRKCAVELPAQPLTNGLNFFVWNRFSSPRDTQKRNCEWRKRAGRFSPGLLTSGGISDKRGRWVALPRDSCGPHNSLANTQWGPTSARKRTTIRCIRSE